MKRNDEWAIVLASGEGSGEPRLTGAGGRAVPRRFWSVDASRSLLGDALARATRIVAPRRVVAVVSEEHRDLWSPELARLAPENLIVQPCDRGTGVTLLCALLSIQRRDPDARVVVLSSDHFVETEFVLTVSLRLALESLSWTDGRIVLLGPTAHPGERGHSWIVPRSDERTLQPVRALVADPGSDLGAQRLIESGATWEGALSTGAAKAYVALFERRLPALARALRRALDARFAGDRSALARLYGRIASVDLVRDVLRGAEERLLLMRVPPCGWTDLATPERALAAVAAVAARRRLPRAPEARPRARFDLASALQGRARRPAPRPVAAC